MATDGEQAMNYERYILPHRLPEVRPREVPADPLRADPDEQLFIRTHQAFEIWFAQILSELEYARLVLSQAYVPESDVPVIEGHVRRAAGIFDLINQHLPLLETLDTTSFYNFRKHLFGASGTQSFRFREVEWLIGLLDDGLLDYSKHKRSLDEKLLKGSAAARTADGPTPSQREHDSLLRYQAPWRQRWDRKRKRLDLRGFEEMDASRAALQARLIDIGTNGTLRQCAIDWLGRTAFPSPRRARPHSRYGDEFATRYREAFTAAYTADSRVLRDLQGVAPREIKQMRRDADRKIVSYLDAQHRRAILFLVQYANEPLLAWPASLVEALLELDQAFANWRDRHIAMVARVLGGGRISTLGAADSGLLYLRETLRKRAFPEIWDARSFMLSREEAAGIYTPRQLRPFGFVHDE